MSALLLRRLFPALLMGFTLLVFTPTPLLANAALPFVFFAAPFMVLWLIPIILIEGYILRRRLSLGTGRAIGVAAVANLASTFVGILLPSIGLSNWGHPSAHSSGTELYLPFFFLLLPLFVISVLVEAPIVKAMLDPIKLQHSPAPPPPFERPRQRTLPSVLLANVASYLFLALVVGGSLAQDILSGPSVWEMRRASAKAVSSLRLINTSEVTYAATYHKGFSPTLDALDGVDTGPPSANAAKLIDSALGRGERNYYRFVYTPGPRNEKGEILTYSFTATPIPPGNGADYYYTDQTEVIRSNPNVPATAKDPPLAG